MQIEKPWWSDALNIFSKITAWVAVPVVVALLVGKYLDGRWGSKPWAFLTLTGIAFIISIIAIGKISLQYIKEIETLKTDKKDGDTRKQ